jgi:hypothetical protein
MQSAPRTIGARRWILLAALLGLAAFAALRGAFGGAFIFDDYALLALPRYFDNPFLPFWHEHVEGGLHYRPMGLLLWWISERLFGAAPLPHYLLNAALLTLDLAVAPAAAKRCGVDRSDGRDVARRGVGDDRRTGRREHIEQPSHHRRGRIDAACGRASGGRR